MTRLPPPAPPTVAARFWFGWTLLWNAILSIGLMLPFVVALRLRPTARTFSVWLRAWARAVLLGSGIRVRSTADARIDGAVVYVANHQAMLDIPVLTLAIPGPFLFVARGELRRLPLVGNVLEHSRCVFLDRATVGGMKAAFAEVGARLGEGDAILFFPEGTRSYDGRLGTFYTGAFRLAVQAGVPVVPVAIGGTYRLLNERRKVARPGRVEVRVGMPIVPGADADALAEAARGTIERMLDEMQTERESTAARPA